MGPEGDDRRHPCHRIGVDVCGEGAGRLAGADPVLHLDLVLDHPGAHRCGDALVTTAEGEGLDDQTPQLMRPPLDVPTCGDDELGDVAFALAPDPTPHCSLVRLSTPLLEDDTEQLLLRPEVRVERARAEASLGTDVGDRRTLVPAAGEHPRCSLDQLLPCLVCGDTGPSSHGAGLPCVRIKVQAPDRRPGPATPWTSPTSSIPNRWSGALLLQIESVYVGLPSKPAKRRTAVRGRRYGRTMETTPTRPSRGPFRTTYGYHRATR